MKFITDFPYPWVLVWFDKRRNIRLGFITKVVVKGRHHDRAVVYHAHTCNENGEWTKHPRRFTLGEIIKMWPARPRESTINIIVGCNRLRNG